MKMYQPYECRWVLKMTIKKEHIKNKAKVTSAYQQKTN